jgi:hypothetical protein
VIKNEKYMGDALLQKSYTVDVLTKQRCINNGDVTQYYVKDHHPAIIDRQTFYLAKGELLRRDAGFSDGKTPGPKIVPDKNDFTHKIICPICKRHYVRYSWGGAGGKAGWICSGRSLGECDGNILKEVELKKMMLEAFQKLWDKQPRVKQKRVPKLNAESSEDELINAAAIHMDNVFSKRVKEFLKSPRPTEYDPLLTKRLVDEITFTNDFNEQVYSVRFNDKTTINVAANCMKPRRGDGKGRKLRRR